MEEVMRTRSLGEVIAPPRRDSRRDGVSRAFRVSPCIHGSYTLAAQDRLDGVAHQGTRCSRPHSRGRLAHFTACTTQCSPRIRAGAWPTAVTERRLR